MAEKDRIAAEIHDSVTQNLFGLVYDLGALAREDKMDQRTRERIGMFQRMARSSMRDLRASIYRLSTIPGETQPFLEECEKYLGDLAELNNIAMKFNHQGWSSRAGSPINRALYRIIREATGNAVRHSQCSEIAVTLDGEGDSVRLTVSDDGCGFSLSGVGVRTGVGWGWFP